MNTRGPELTAFAAGMGVEFLPWQKELSNRALETLPDGSWRWQTVVCVVGRQSGKSTFCAVLALWRMVSQPGAMVLGMAQGLALAMEAWKKAVDLAEDRGIADKVQVSNGKECLTLANKSRYRTVASSRSGARGYSIDLLLMDEAREQRDWDAYTAATPAVTARPGSQVWLISNAGDDESIVLNSMREKGLAGGESTVGVFEWSGDPSLEIDDVAGWAQGCPGLGHLTTVEMLRGQFETLPAARFRTEILCQRVVNLDGAVDMAAWQACMDETVTLDAYRSRVALCVDVSADGSHTSLVAAVVDDSGLVRVEALAGWDSLTEARRGLPGWVERVRPAVLGWFPSGPAQQLGTELRLVGEELKGQAVTEACMAFADCVLGLRLRHAGDALLTAHVGASEKQHQADAWRFARPRLGGNVDAAFAAAGAVWLARELAVKPKAATAFVL